jgi:two-component system phosphate regulon sensor histidine kinase PhoR
MPSFDSKTLTVITIGAGGLFLCLGVLEAFRVVQIGTAAALIGASAVIGIFAIKLAEIRREAEQSLARRESELRSIRDQAQRQQTNIDALSDGLTSGLFVCDSKGRIEYANKTAREMFRIDNISSKSIVALTLSHELEKLVIEASASNEPKTVELTFSYPSDKVGLAKAWISPDGRVFLSLYEITELRRLERVRQDFVANVSHEMRTPMTIIRNFAETLLDDDDRALKDRYLNKIIAEVDRLSVISQDLLILSAAESGPVRKQSCDIADVFRSAVHQLEDKARDKGLLMAYRGLEAFLIEANLIQMTQVALNLVENAINYTLEGGVTVSLAASETDVTVTIEDTGIGIASEHLPRIFERFYRVDKARSRGSGGTGLGLSIVKHIVEAHGGRVDVNSSLHRGSTFTVVLPIGDVPPTEPRG